MNKNLLFLENFYTLLNAGYSVEETLKVCQSLFDMQYIGDMQKKLNEGYDIYYLFDEYPFPDIFKEYLQFYKNKNCLSEALEKSLKIYKTKQAYQTKLKSKLNYPLILLVFVFLFSFFVVFILLPNVNQLFSSFGIKKNFITQIFFSLFHLFPLILMVSFIFGVFFFIRLFYGLKHKQYKIIEQYLKLPIMKIVLQKYFSLKFALYYHELSLEDMDSSMIINILNQQMKNSDIKIVLYEMNNRINEGEAIEDILNDFEYFDQLFLTFFKMYLENPKQHQSIENYIQLTYKQIDFWVAQFIKYFIPFIYGFVALFVITIYISIIIPMMNVISDI